MRKQIWKRVAATVGIITILASNVPDLMTVRAAEGDAGTTVSNTSTTGGETAGSAGGSDTSQDSISSVKEISTVAGDYTQPTANGGSTGETSTGSEGQPTGNSSGTSTITSSGDSTKTSSDDTNSTTTTSGTTTSPDGMPTEPSGTTTSTSTTTSTGTDQGTSQSDADTSEISTEDKSVSLTGTCQADGQTIEGHDSFSIGFDGDSDTLDVNSFAPSIEGYSFTGTATLNGDPVSQIRKHTTETTETKDTADGKGQETVVTGRTLILQYSSDPSDDSSWKDLTNDATVQFSYTKSTGTDTGDQVTAALKARCVNADENDSVIDGHGDEKLPSFDTTLDLTAQPIAIDGFAYVEARLGDTVITSLTNAKQAADQAAGEDVSSQASITYTAKDGTTAALDKDAVITLVYESAQQISAVKLTLRAVDEDGKAIDGFEHPDMPAFDGELVLNKEDKAPVAIEGYDYTNAKIDGTVVTSLTETLKKNHGEDVTVYSYTADGKNVELKKDTEITLSYKAQAKKTVLTAAYVDADGKTLEGYEDKDSLPAFDDRLALDGKDSEPAEIKDWIFKEAKIGDKVITSLTKTSKKIGIHDIDVYSYTTGNSGTEDGSADGKAVDITEDTKITFVYEPADKIVKVDASCVDEFGKKIEDKYTALELSGFDDSGRLELNDTDNPPVKNVQIRKGLFKVVRYSYVQATVDGTIIRALKREKAKLAKKSSYTGDRSEAYVYSYTADGSEWTKITEDTTVKLEYNDGSKTDFTYEDDNVVVTAKLQYSGAIPDDAELKVTPVTPDTAGYNYDAYMQALNDNADKIENETGLDLSATGNSADASSSAAAQDPEISGTAKEAATAFTQENTLLYDIAFMADKTDEDGNVIEGEKEEFEPTEGAVKISMVFKQKQLSADLKVESAGDVAVVHLPLDNAVKEDVDSTKDATAISAGDVNVDVVSKDAASVNAGSEDQVDFSLDSFSLFSLLAAGPMMENTPVTNTYTVNNTTYNYADGEKVTYTVDAPCSIKNGNTIIATITTETGGSFEVDESLTSFTIETTETSVTVTLDATKTDCAVIGSNPQTLTTVGKTPVPAVTFISQKAAASYKVYKDWEDGGVASENKPTVSFTLEYATNMEGPWTELTVDNMSSLGYTTLPSVTDATANTVSSSEWSYEFTKQLLTYDAGGNRVYYRLYEGTAPVGYVASYRSDDHAKLVNTKKVSISVEKKWEDGNNSYDSRPDKATWIAGLTAKRTADGGVTWSAITLTTESSSAEGYVIVDTTNNPWTITMPNALGYSEDDFPYIYKFEEPEKADVVKGSHKDDGSYYKTVYKNENNYATRTDALFPGGMATNTLVNTEQFTGAKKWLDDGTTTRPTATLELYRYPKVPGDTKGTYKYDYTTASPVPGVSTYTIDKTKDSDITITGTTTDLPMYNEDGYEYIYFAKEKLSGGDTYEQVLLNPDTCTENGKASFLFQGGTLENRITGIVKLTATKNWIATSRADEDAAVTMSLSRSVDGEDPVWVNDVVITGFGAETMSKSIDFDKLPEYDENGHRYTYSVKEKKVTTPDGNTEWTTKTEVVNKQTITYVISPDGYRYRQEISSDGTTVTNTLVGNAEIDINKEFGNGLLADTTLTYTIYQNGNSIGTVKRTYNTTEHKEVPFTPAPIKITDYNELTTRASGVPASGLLPRYDDQGAEYGYTISETGFTPKVYESSETNSKSEGTYSAGSFSGEKYLIETADITNNQPGNGTTISVYKNWVDDNDQLYHDTVNFELQYTADGGTSWEKVAEGSISKGNTFTSVGIPDDSEKSARDYATLYGTWNALTADQKLKAVSRFRVVEISLGKFNIQKDSEVNSTDPKENNYHPEHESGWSFVSTDNQNYDVSSEAAIGYAARDGKTYSFGITNKRVGVEQIVLTKAWVDGSDQGKKRPASLAFTVTASENVFSDGAGGKTNTKSYSVTSANANSTNGNVWDYTIKWLTKYDNTGKIIKYSIKEDSTPTGYSSSSSHVSYVVGAQHTGDIDTYAFTNTLTGTVSPFMNKYWKDDGTQTRPDIYPVLIRSFTKNGNTSYECMSYQDRDWKTEVVNTNWWQCSFVPQARYNSEGYEYTYYVGEKFSGNSGLYENTGAYDEQPTASGTFSEYNGDGTPKTDVDFIDGANVTWVSGSAQFTGYVAKLLDNEKSASAGTIVNRLKGNRTISGVKVWSNFPEGWYRNYVPDVTFTLWRKIGTGSEEQVATDGTTYVEGGLKTAITAVLESGSSAFSFGTDNLPRYNNDGQTYTYFVKEQTPTTMGITYTVKSSLISGITVTNAYNQNQGYSVQFSKNWTGPEGVTLAGSSTLTLARYIVKDGVVLDGTNGTKNTRDITSFATSATYTSEGTGGTSGTGTSVMIGAGITRVTWSNLAYYGPDGEAYQYRIEESNVSNGYTVYDAAGTTEIAASDKGYTVSVTGSYDTINQKGSGTAGLTNKYGVVLGSIKLTKSWNNTSNQFNVNPDVSSAIFELYRKTADGTVTSEDTGYSVTLSAQNNWEATFSGFEVYAPNGSQYTYWAVETPIPTGYTVGYTPAGTSGVTLTSGGTASISAKNFITAAKVTLDKKWKGIDAGGADVSSFSLLFENGLYGVPSSITYKFLYSTDNGTTWNLVQKLGSDGTTYSDWTQTQKYDYSTQQEWRTYLPATDASGHAVRYKVFEYQLTYTDKNKAIHTVTRANETETEYECTFGKVSSFGSMLSTTFPWATTVTNAIPVEPITVTKTWDDEYNRDGKRPASVSYTITRTNVDDTNDTAQTTVILNAENKSTDDNTWSATYYVPIWNFDGSAKSTYTVAENTIESTRGYTTTVGTNGTDYAEADNNLVSLGDTSTGHSAYFKNSRVHATITLTPKKVWSYEGTTYDGSKPLPEWLQAYMPTSITFTLQASKDGTNWYDTSATDTSNFGTDFTSINGFSATKVVTVLNTTGAITVGNSWSGLPRYVSDTDVGNPVKYQYRVTEALNPETSVYSLTSSVVDASTADAATATVTATNAFARLQLAITKTWSDSNNAYNTRPSAIKYTVQYKTNTTATEWTKVPDTWTNGKTENGVVTVTPTDKNEVNAYNTTIDSLPKYAADGITEYQYRAEETALVYDTDVTPGTEASDNKPYYVSSETTLSGSTFTTAFTNTMDMTSFTVKKSWIDTKPGIVSQVSAITFYLQKSSDNGANWTFVFGSDGTTCDSWTINTNGALDITRTIETLPQYASSGKAYRYRAVEASITVDGNIVTADNFEGSLISGTVGGFTNATTTEDTTSIITNTTSTTMVKATKIWSDKNNANGERPISITYHLLQNKVDLGSDYYKTLTAAGTWAAVTWNRLPAQDAAGNAYTYTVAEAEVPGYTNSITGTGTDVDPYVVTNIPIPVSISKTAANGTKLAGAKFTLAGIFTNGTDEITKDWSSSSTDVWNLTGLLVQNNVYTLNETVPPKGYTLPSTATTYLKVKTDGKLYKDMSSTGNFTTLVTGNELFVEDVANEITISKVGADGTSALGGATFTITGTFVDTTDRTKTTVDNTTITTSGNPFSLTGRLIAGNPYTIKEISAPDGYLTMKSSFTVIMGTDGHLTAGNLPDGVTIGYDATNGATIKVADQPTSLTLQKVDTASPTPKLLKGATFTVEPVDDGKFATADKNNSYTAARTILSGESSNTWTGQFVAGDTYIFRETTTPEGYFTVAPFKVKVNTYDTLEFVGDHENVTLNGNIVTAADASLNAGMKLTKLDAAIGAALTTQKTKFTLIGVLGNTTIYSERTITTDENGQISFSNLPQGTYTLAETDADENYVNGGFKAEFTVSDACKNQTLTINSDSLGNKTPFNLTVTKDSNDLVKAGLQNVRKTGTVNVEKLGADGKALKNVTFEVHRKSDNSMVGTAGTTDANGKVSFKDLAWDTYYLLETAVPNGYRMDLTHHEFTIGYGDLTKNFTVAENGAISNTLNSFSLLKKDGSGNALSGAEFKVSGIFSDGNGVQTDKTITESDITWTGLLIVGNTYEITETKAPSKYYAVAPFQVTMQNDGSLMAAAGTVLPLGVSIDGSTITVQDYPINVSISKVNSSGTPLAGAVLRITDTAGNIVVPQWTSEITPKVIKDNDLLIAGQKYILEEMSAPSGYDKASPVTFTIENTAKAAEGVMRTDVVMVDPTTPSPSTPSSPSSPEEPLIPPVVPKKPVPPTTPTVPIIPTVPDTPHYYDVNHNEVPPDFPGEVYDENGGKVKGASRGYDKYGNVLGAGRGRSGIPGTGDDSAMLFYGGLTAAAAAGIVAWILSRRKKKK